MDINIQNTFKFLKYAKKKAYASRLTFPKKTAFGGKQYIVKKDNLTYIDLYHGDQTFTGNEIILINNSPFWSMVYYGGIKDNSTNKNEYENYTRLNYNTVFKNIKNFVSSAKDNNFDGRYRIIIVGSENPESDMKYWSKVGIEAKVYQKLSRGGSIETDMETKNEIFGCKYNRDKEWMHILSNGDVVLCCMDWYREHKLGNVQESSLYDIWNGTNYQKIREKINHSDDRDFICNKCEWGLTNKNL